MEAVYFSYLQPVFLGFNDTSEINSEAFDASMIYFSSKGELTSFSGINLNNIITIFADKK